jgi:hypothetical protein
MVMEVAETLVTREPEMYVIVVRLGMIDEGDIYTVVWLRFDHWSLCCWPRATTDAVLRAVRVRSAVMGASSIPARRASAPGNVGLDVDIDARALLEKLASSQATILHSLFCFCW